MGLRAVLLILSLAYVIFIVYLFKDIDCTAKLVASMRTCFNTLNPNNTIPDQFQFGVDNISQNFVTEITNIDIVCRSFNAVNGMNYFMQRTYYLDKQIIQTFQNDKEFKQFVLLGAGTVHN